MFISDIDNSLCNTSEELSKIGVEQKAYPAPLPEGFWTSKKGLIIFSEVKPLKGAPQFLRNLKRKYGALAYVTSRPPESRFITLRWLQLTGHPKAPIYFCADAREKLKVAAKLGATIALEDDPLAVQLYAQAGIAVLMPGWEYNQHVDYNGVARIEGVVKDGYGA